MPEITIREAARRLGVDPSTLRHWIIRKKIPVNKVHERTSLIDTKQLSKYKRGIGGKPAKDPEE